MVPEIGAAVQTAACDELHAASPPASMTVSTIAPSIVRQRRRRAGMPNNSRQARAAPPVRHGSRSCGTAVAEQEPEELATVDTVMGAVACDVPLSVTVPDEPKPKVGGSVAPEGLEVTAALNTTLPVNPLGVTVMVEVLFAVAPAERETFVPPTANAAGVTAAVTVMDAAPDAELKIVPLVESGV